MNIEEFCNKHNIVNKNNKNDISNNIIIEWLIENKNIFITTDVSYDFKNLKWVYRFYITDLLTQDRYATLDNYDTNKKCINAAIEYVIKNLL